MILCQQVWSRGGVVQGRRVTKKPPFLPCCMGRLFKRCLEGPEVWCCSGCGTHLSTNDQIISKQFTGRGGRAFLFDKVLNVTTGPHEKRVLITGLHTVADIYCLDCETLLGWKYEEAFEESQKYKEGKFILEKTKISKDEDWL